MRAVFFTLCLLLAPPALAGVVVLKNGQVVIGKLKVENVDQEQIKVTWPYKDFPSADEDGRGEMVIPQHRVRWYDMAADAPTDAYWAEFSEEEIADEWKGAREEWRLRQQRTDDGPGELPAEQTSEDSAKLITEDPAASSAATPAETPAQSETPAQTPAAAPADSGGSGFCSLHAAAPASGAGPLAALALVLLGLRRRRGAV